MRKRKGSDLFLWYRIGDNGDYHHVGDDLDALADVLHEADIGEVTSRCHLGIMTEYYPGNNYISLFWADETGENDFKDLTKSEYDKLVRELTARDNKSMAKKLADGLNALMAKKIANGLNEYRKREALR